MASDQLRKKWGTIFMGEREATPQQLDAMQEPVLRERMQHQQEEDYLARVRARAEERAREILGAAYAERHKVLDEAGAEGQARVRQLTEEARALKARAQAELAEAEAERGQARDLRQEAENIRRGAHAEGFQAGMDQAGEELKEFRADVGQMLGNLLRAVEAQRGSLVEDWRAQLAELTRVAVEAGTGWVLEAEHRRILRNLVFTSLQLLEDRATVSIRVHPDDEETVGDLFRAARERVPELSQWIVNGDEALEPGDLVAESLSGSVENLRAHYREMVNGILEHLTLPQSPGEAQTGEAAAAVGQRELDRLAALEPRAVPQAVEPAPASETASAAASAVESTPGDAREPAQDEAPLSPADAPVPTENAVATGEPGAEAPMSATARFETPVSKPSADPVGAPPQAATTPEPGMDRPEAADVSPAAAETAQELVSEAPEEPASHAPAHSPEHAPAPSSEPPSGLSSGSSEEPAPNQAEPDRPANAAPDQEPAAEAAPRPHADNPSLAELEDELFPLPEEDDAAAARSADVFANGGFLPGADDGRTE